MCLLTTGSSKAIRTQLLNTPGLIEDVYASNSDGLGAMYVTAKGQIKVIKVLPKSAEDAKAVIAALPNDNRELALHWRMRTHGHINVDQVHPYRINDASWLMHNGILATGNKADETKSDTWHFAKDYLAHMPPDALHSEGVLNMLADYIGNNRFAILSVDGRLSVVNREQGIEHDGVWYSNTYAWSPELLIPDYSRKTFAGFGGRYRGFAGIGGHMGAAYHDFDWVEGSTRAWPDEDGAADDNSLEDFIHECIENYEVTDLALLLEDSETRGETIDVILTSYEITPYLKSGRDSAAADDVPEITHAAAKAWRDYNDDALAVMSATTPHATAEALAYYCNADYKSRVTPPPKRVVLGLA